MITGRFNIEYCVGQKVIEILSDEQFERLFDSLETSLLNVEAVLQVSVVL